MEREFHAFYYFNREIKILQFFIVLLLMMMSFHLIKILYEVLLKWIIKNRNIRV